MEGRGGVKMGGAAAGAAKTGALVWLSCRLGAGGRRISPGSWAFWNAFFCSGAEEDFRTRPRSAWVEGLVWGLESDTGRRYAELKRDETWGEDTTTLSQKHHKTSLSMMKENSTFPLVFYRVF